MKSTGIVRGIDALGRIVLPKELRTSMHLDTDTKLEIFVMATPSCSKSIGPPAAAISVARWMSLRCSLRATASARPAAARSVHCKTHKKEALL